MKTIKERMEESNKQFIASLLRDAMQYLEKQKGIIQKKYGDDLTDEFLGGFDAAAHHLNMFGIFASEMPPAEFNEEKQG